MDPTDNLARFEQMAQRAKARREKAETDERLRQVPSEEERTRQQLAAGQDQFLAGPPGGCGQCFVFRQVYVGVLVWQWDHVAPIDPELRPFDHTSFAEEQLVEHCTHRCHGPAGYPLPIIAYA